MLVALHTPGQAIRLMERAMVNQHARMALLERELAEAHEQAGHYRAILEQIGYFAEETPFLSFTVSPELCERLMVIAAETGTCGSDLLTLLCDRFSK